MREYTADEARKIILEKLRLGWSVDRAVDFVGKSRATYEYYMDPKRSKDNGAFRGAVAKIRRMQAGETAELPVPDFEDFSAQYLGMRLFDHQKQWLDLLEGREPRNLHPSQVYVKGRKDLLLINTPPHHSKTMMITTNYVTWRILKDPNTRVLVVSASADQAEKILHAIKERLEGSTRLFEELKSDFAPLDGFDGNGAKWTQRMIYVNPALRTRGEKDPTVQALGIRKKIYGARADLIILDDCADLDNAHEYEKQINWIQTIINSRLEPGTGKMIIVGTRLTAQDLYSEIMKPHWYVSGEAPWTYLTQPAVLESGDTPEQWKTLWPRTNVHPPGLDRHEPDPQGLYPMWNGQRLAQVRDNMSAENWARVYMQQQVSESTTFTQAQIDGCTNGLRFPGPMVAGQRGHRPEGMSGLYVVAGLDPAATNYTAMAVVGVDRSSGRRYLLDVWNQHGALPAQTSAVMKDWTKRYGVCEWRIETNAYQASIMQDEDLRSWMAARSVRMSPHTTGKNKWDAQWGVASMSNLFNGWEQGYNAIEFPSRKGHPGIQSLVEQLVAWYPTPSMTKAPVQDTVMALWFAEIRCRELMDQQDGATHWDSGWTSQRDRDEQVVINIDQYALNGSPSPQVVYDTPGKWWQ